MTQEHRVSEKEQAIPFLVIPDVLFTFLVVTTELLFSEHSRAHDASDDLWHAQSLPVGHVCCVWGVLCVCSLIYSDFKQFSLLCMALYSQCSFD